MIKKYSRFISSLLASGFLIFSLQGCQSGTSDYADTQRLTQSSQVSDNTAANQETYSDNSGDRLSYDKSDTQYTTPDDFSQMREGKNYGESQVISYYSSTVGRYRNANVMRRRRRLRPQSRRPPRRLRPLRQRPRRRRPPHRPRQGPR